jgi:hypothetical protein
MQRIYAWEERRVGDVFLYAGTAELSKLIIEAEKILNPPTASHPWVPSHAGVIGPVQGEVTEAWLDDRESSAAAVHFASKYNGEFIAGRMQLWRPRAIDPDAIGLVVSILGPKPYGVGSILGFEWIVAEQLIFGHAGEQPVKHATVCSMTALVYLRYTRGERWSDLVDERSCSPDVLLRNIEANPS